MVFFLFLLNLLLSYSLITIIMNRAKGTVKGTNIVTIRNDHIIRDKNSYLKFFYEPKPNNIETYNPSWLGYTVNININSDSLNERFEYLINKKKSTYRIITIGDSFTYGDFVNTSDNYSEILENMLNMQYKCARYEKFEVINLGVHGYDAEYTVERFVKRGIKYNPDLVIWLIHNWNIDRIADYIRSFWELYPEDNNSGGNNEKAEKVYQDLLNKNGLKWLTEYQNKVFKRLADNYVGKILITSFSDFKDEYREIIYDFVNKNSNNFYYKDMLGYWDNMNYRFLDNHPNIEGHKKIANNLFNYLKNNIITECN